MLRNENKYVQFKPSLIERVYAEYDSEMRHLGYTDKSATLRIIHNELKNAKYKVVETAYIKTLEKTLEYPLDRYIIRYIVKADDIKKLLKVDNKDIQKKMYDVARYLSSLKVGYKINYDNNTLLLTSDDVNYLVFYFDTNGSIAHDNKIIGSVNNLTVNIASKLKNILKNESKQE